jgi:hypothetical protein
MGWCIIIIFALIIAISSISSDFDSYKKESERKIEELKTTVENLKDPAFIMKEKRIMDAQLDNLNKLTTYESIKIPRVPLGNLVRAFKSNYVWLQMKDLLKLEITDGISTVTLPCQPEKKKNLR